VTRFSNKDKNVSFSCFFSSWVLSLFYDSLVCKLMTHHWLLTHQARGWLCETSLFSLRREKREKMLFFNQNHGYLEGLVRGFKNGLLNQSDIRILFKIIPFHKKIIKSSKFGMSLRPNETDYFSKMKTIKIFWTLERHWHNVIL